MMTEQGTDLRVYNYITPLPFYLSTHIVISNLWPLFSLTVIICIYVPMYIIYVNIYRHTHTYIVFICINIYIIIFIYTYHIHIYSYMCIYYIHEYLYISIQTYKHMYYACVLKYNLLSLYNFTFISPFRVLSWSNCRNWFSKKEPLPIARVLRWGITREHDSNFENKTQ